VRRGENFFVLQESKRSKISSNRRQTNKSAAASFGENPFLLKIKTLRNVVQSVFVYITDEFVYIRNVIVYIHDVMVYIPGVLVYIRDVIVYIPDGFVYILIQYIQDLILL